MHHTFVDAVETLEPIGDDLAVTFARRPGHYRLKPEPSDLQETLRKALTTGTYLRITYDTASFEIADALID